MKILLIISLVFSFSIQALSQELVGPNEDIKQILRSINNFSSHYINGNYDSLANCYTEDGIILPPGADIIMGRAAIKKRWVLPEGVSVPYHKITPVELTVIGDVAYDIGYYEGRTLKKDGSEVEWNGKYLIVWKKIDEEWKIYADAWNRID